MSGERPLRVLAWPAWAFAARQPFQAQLADELTALGVRVADFTPRTALGRHDVWHLHWPERAFASPRPAKALVKTGLVALALAYAHRRGAKLVWTVHNLQSHDGRHPGLERWLWRFLGRRLAGIIHLSETSRGELARLHPELAAKPAVVIPHGHFRAAYPASPARAAARAHLGLPADAPVVLYFGQIRPYKNVPALLAAWAPLAAAGARLVVVGRPASAADRAAVEAAARGCAGVDLRLALVPREEVPTYFAAADLVALPYREILNSGAALLALSFDRPVLLPRRGALAELAASLGAGWVRTYDGELTAGVLQAALAAPQPGPRAPLDHLDWPPLAAATLAFYRQLLAA